MVWVGISIDRRMDLYLIRNGILKAQWYADETLRFHVVPYTAAIGNSFLLMQDNTRSHTARHVENFVEAVTI